MKNKNDENWSVVQSYILNGSPLDILLILFAIFWWAFTYLVYGLIFALPFLYGLNLFDITFKGSFGAVIVLITLGWFLHQQYKKYKNK